MAMLAGRVALVTGGGRGIGRCIALALARDGAAVAVAARTAGQVGAVCAEIGAGGGRALALTADVTCQEDVTAMAARTSAELGLIDILVNCAGEAESAPFLRTDPEMWERTLALNLTSVYRVTRAVLPGMLERGWGRILNIASTAGLEGKAYVTAYCAAKHGVVGLTRALAQETGPRGVTVNALCPGYVDTDMTRRSAERIASKTALSREEALASLARFNPSGRLLAPEEVAAAAMRLVQADGGSANGLAVAL